MRLLKRVAGLFFCGVLAAGILFGFGMEFGETLAHWLGFGG